MRDKLLVLLLMPMTLFGASKESLNVTEFRIELKTFAQDLNNQKRELELIQERLSTLSSSLDQSHKESAQLGKAENESAKEKLSAMEKRVSLLETGQKSLIQDCKVLKEHLNEAQATLSKYDDKIALLDKQLSQDLRSLKSSLQSMMGLLQPSSSASPYTVQPGDSLGKIAQSNRTTIKKLKELNHLSGDEIYPGQKLIIQE